MQKNDRRIDGNRLHVLHEVTALAPREMRPRGFVAKIG
jgi:hypothetical protein